MFSTYKRSLQSSFINIRIVYGILIIIRFVCDNFMTLTTLYLNQWFFKFFWAKHLARPSKFCRAKSNFFKLFPKIIICIRVRAYDLQKNLSIFFLQKTCFMHNLMMLIMNLAIVFIMYALENGHTCKSVWLSVWLPSPPTLSKSYAVGLPSPPKSCMSYAVNFDPPPNRPKSYAVCPSPY